MDSRFARTNRLRPVTPVSQRASRASLKIGVTKQPFMRRAKAERMSEEVDAGSGC